MAKFDLSSVYSSENTYSVLKLLKKLIDKIDSTEFATPDDVQAVKDYVDAELTNYVTQQGLSLVLEDYTTLATLNSRLSGYYPKIDGLEIRSDIEIADNPGSYSSGVKTTKYPLVLDVGDFQYQFFDDGLAYVVFKDTQHSYELLTSQMFDTGFTMYDTIHFNDGNGNDVYSVGFNTNIFDDDFCVITPPSGNRRYILFTNNQDDSQILSFSVNNAKELNRIILHNLNIDFGINNPVVTIFGESGTRITDSSYENTSIELNDDGISIYGYTYIDTFTDNFSISSISTTKRFVITPSTGEIMFYTNSGLNSFGNIHLNKFVINMTLSGDFTPTLLSTTGVLSIADSSGENAEITLNSQGVITFYGISYEFNGETLSITDGVNSHGWHFDTTTWEFWYTDGNGVDHQYATQDWVTLQITAAVLPGVTFDNVPTQNSNNAVKSGGVYDAIESSKEDFIYSSLESIKPLTDTNYVDITLSGLGIGDVVYVGLSSSVNNHNYIDTCAIVISGESVSTSMHYRGKIEGTVSTTVTLEPLSSGSFRVKFDNITSAYSNYKAYITVHKEYF